MWLGLVFAMVIVPVSGLGNWVWPIPGMLVGLSSLDVDSLKPSPMAAPFVAVPLRYSFLDEPRSALRTNQHSLLLPTRSGYGLWLHQHS